MAVTPWDVTGAVDYQKLIQDFGTQAISPSLLKRIEKHGKLHPMLRRGFYYSHRDLDKIITDHEKKKGFFLYTGLAPSKPIHIGNILSFELTKWFQDVFNVNVYIQIPDEEKFLTGKVSSLKDVENIVDQEIANVAAVGFNPDKTFIFKDREYIQHMYDAALLVAKKTTFSTAKAVFGFSNSTNIGLSFYPAMQAVPTFLEKRRCLIPSAIDQDPYWRVQRDVAESLGYVKTAAVHSKFLPPLGDAGGKMSSSGLDRGAIYFNDTEKEVKNKINKYAFSGGQATIEEHRKKGGRTERDISYQWLEMFFEPDDKKLHVIHDDYESGKILSGEIKHILIDRVNGYLKDHKKKKAQSKAAIKKMQYTGKLAKKMWNWNIEY
jgi:tryptophanyl-tRNA synthetase